MDVLDKNFCPTLEEIGKYVRNPVFIQFCSEIKERYKCMEKIEFSSCSWEKGWNVKFKKVGKTLCAIYPRKGYFTVMVVVGVKEKDAVQTVLPDCNAQLQRIYDQTREGNGQKWLMIDLEDKGSMYDDTLRLIDIRRGRTVTR